jgi:transcriptional regulator with XRE-family HTH domain
VVVTVLYLKMRRDKMNALKLARLKKDLTMIQLADKLNVTRKTISNWEKKESKPSVSKVMDLHRVLDISLDDLMDFFEEGKKEETK